MYAESANPCKWLGATELVSARWKSGCPSVQGGGYEPNIPFLFHKRGEWAEKRMTKTQFVGFFWVEKDAILMEQAFNMPVLYIHIPSEHRAL